MGDTPKWRWGKDPRDPKRHKLSRATPLNFTKYKARNFAPPQTHEEATCWWTRHVRHEYWCRHTDTHLQPTARTACSAAVRFLPIRLTVNKAKKKSWNALIAHARTLPFLCSSQRTLFTTSPVGAVSVQGNVRSWARYVAYNCVHILYIKHTKTHVGSLVYVLFLWPSASNNIQSTGLFVLHNWGHKAEYVLSYWQSLI
jgi:hypothetical protein